jgi:NADPH:quinone reductase-like Zn-dependent oxidoreductase
MRKCAGLVLAQGSSHRIYGELGPGLAITHYGNARSDSNYLTAWADAWNVIVPLLQSGAIKPIMAKTFPLAEAADALRYLVEGRPFGRVVLTI